IKLNLNSAYLDLKDIMSLAAPTRGNSFPTQPVNKQSKKLQQINDRIDNILTLGQLNLNMNIQHIQLGNFNAFNNKVNVDFLTDKIQINNASLEQSQGFIQMNGVIHQSLHNNPFHIEGVIQDVNV